MVRIMTPEYIPCDFLMKQARFHISLYIIIPIIFSGIASFSAIVIYQMTRGFMRQNIVSSWPMVFWIIIIAFGAFLCGLLVVRLLLKPVERFVRQAEQLPAHPRS